MRFLKNLCTAQIGNSISRAQSVPGSKLKLSFWYTRGKARTVVGEVRWDRNSHSFKGMNSRAGLLTWKTTCWKGGAVSNFYEILLKLAQLLSTEDNRSVQVFDSLQNSRALDGFNLFSPLANLTPFILLSRSKLAHMGKYWFRPFLSLSFFPISFLSLFSFLLLLRVISLVYYNRITSPTDRSLSPLLSSSIIVSPRLFSLCPLSLSLYPSSFSNSSIVSLGSSHLAGTQSIALSGMHQLLLAVEKRFIRPSDTTFQLDCAPFPSWQTYTYMP